MGQNSIVFLIFIAAIVYLYRELAPKSKKKTVQAAATGGPSPGCGCGSACPLKPAPKSKQRFGRFS